MSLKLSSQMVTEVEICDFSDYIIYFLNAQGVIITPLKLQKVLYYSQAWHLVFFEKHSLFNEAPEAWVNGPVYRTIYNKYSKNWFKNNPLTPVLPEGVTFFDRLNEILEVLQLEEDQQACVDAVLMKYGFMEQEKLVYLTHAELPWNEARKGLGILQRSDKKISLETMYSYYKSRTENNG
ncbi:Panacea domain-containing protein [Chitinophaga tropicalis]|uniref:DUF4065 domain-containing protein n=1 Tax=Chitinophaga tropicalis TaxID=2683588 RepID=A0A7K1UC13_9BACT|nr:type II toxin-antitoxin system antitoxin SocA domain-containing protein [Chitinophaga tropicalis]MVT11846.1 DUF4065 domain-containing protein [Chitinophaga tropicalis]